MAGEVRGGGGPLFLLLLFLCCCCLGGGGVKSFSPLQIRTRNGVKNCSVSIISSVPIDSTCHVPSLLLLLLSSSCDA